MGTPTCFKEIAILDIHPKSRSSNYFFEKTVEALELISNTDPRRFKIVIEQISLILHASLPMTAKYRRSGHICTVDFGHFPFDRYPEWSVKDYACTIVHEATHGRIFQHMISITHKTLCRMESICITESMRFARKWTGDPFNWESYFNKELETVKPLLHNASPTAC